MFNKIKLANKKVQRGKHTTFVKCTEHVAGARNMSSESRAKKRSNCFAHGPKAAINTKCGKELNMNDVTSSKR